MIRACMNFVKSTLAIQFSSSFPSFCAQMNKSSHIHIQIDKMTFYLIKQKLFDAFRCSIKFCTEMGRRMSDMLSVEALLHVTIFP